MGTSILHRYLNVDNGLKTTSAFKESNLSYVSYIKPFMTIDIAGTVGMEGKILIVYVNASGYRVSTNYSGSVILYLSNVSDNGRITIFSNTTTVSKKESSYYMLIKDGAKYTLDNYSYDVIYITRKVTGSSCTMHASCDVKLWSIQDT